MRLTWTRNKPSEPGAYWLRGVVLGKPASTALVEVRRRRGCLMCNLNEPNNEDNVDEWFHVSDLSPAFRWCGPLVPPNG